MLYQDMDKIESIDKMPNIIKYPMHILTDFVLTDFDNAKTKKNAEHHI